MAISTERQIMNAAQIERTTYRVASEILECHGGTQGYLLIAIQEGGVAFAERVAAAIIAIVDEESSPVLVGAVEIGLYRDDYPSGGRPSMRETVIPAEDLAEFTTILVDDVIQKGRSTLAAMNALNAHSRSRTFQVAVLIDRGGRELPIEVKFLGGEVSVAEDETVEVRISKTPNEADEVVVVKKEG